ncbi:hypothetical protein [Nocardia veterana]|uniref:Uncharacterized protein n=1 Tax=Nocardia veterana TaxID=132249 RepID=A0A7X6M218_9NOCA|nr:hypothetical protein [Nocardia veterana]NKY88833.1 hypothetical protein [Nocardia veterana]
MTDVELDIWIPEGFAALPLTDIDRHVAAVANTAKSLSDSETREMAAGVLPIISILLKGLAQWDVRYCGFGRHVASSGTPVTSCLTVCLYETGGDKLNPRLVLKDLVETRLAAGDDLGSIELVDVDTRPILFSERIRELPSPRFTGSPYDSETASTYQLEAVLPAESGTAVAAVELSTAYIDDGPEFRRMIFDMARSAAFHSDFSNSSALNW